jgi:hypothetical protein
MAVEPSVAAAQPAAASGATSRAGVGARFSSGDQLEGMSGSPFISLSDQWRTGNDPNANQSAMQQWLRGGGTPILVTPRVSLAAASFSAMLGMESSDSEAPSMGLSATDRQRAVGTYEYNMRITSGSQRDQGSVINRFI